MNNQESQGTTNQPDKGLGEMRCSFAIGDRLRVKANEWTTTKGDAGKVILVKSILPAPGGDPSKKAIMGFTVDREMVFLMDKHFEKF